MNMKYSEGSVFWVQLNMKTFEGSNDSILGFGFYEEHTSTQTYTNFHFYIFDDVIFDHTKTVVIFFSMCFFTPA